MRGKKKIKFVLTKQEQNQNLSMITVKWDKMKNSGVKLTPRLCGNHLCNQEAAERGIFVLREGAERGSKGESSVAARGCVYRSLCLCAGAHKWKIRVTAKNAKGNPRRQTGNQENGKGVMENSISGDMGRNGNNWDFSTGRNRRWRKGQKHRNRK